MGIPSYFVHIVKSHGSVIKRYQKNTIKIQNLYIDSNSIVYDAVREIEYNNTNNTSTPSTYNNNYETKIINWVCDKIDYYINLISPSNKVLIAFDGVAPVAKLEQQRNRRYKSWYTADKLSNKVGEKWDTTAITPGTEFMTKLYTGVSSYFNKNLNKNLNNLDIMISGSNFYGEGEHKIYKYIRDHKEYHTNTNTIIYGLDADLIMLTLIHTVISNNLYLFRETPHFISSLNNNLIPNEHYVLDIFELSDIINKEMTVAKPVQNDKPVLCKDCVNDYIFICFMLGNDFMPHFPALNIRTNGIRILLDTYLELFGSTNEVLVDYNKIHWKNLRKFIITLAEKEEQQGIEEMKIRSKQEKKLHYKNEEEKLNAIPLLERNVEHYINIGEIGWQERYYKELFHIDITDERKRQICINYLEGLEWNFKYYTNGCPDWTWKYKYSYPPLLEDLAKYIPYFDTTFIEIQKDAPVLPLVQLSYVLPRNSLDLLPKHIYEKLIIEHSDWYRLDFEIQWAYCKYFWESHIILPEIDINILNKIIK